MRRLRASLCLVLSLLTTGLPSFAAEIEIRPADVAPIVGLETPRLPNSLPLEAAVLPNALAPLNFPGIEVPTSAQTAAVAASVQARASASASAAAVEAPGSIGRAETITAAAAGAQKAEASTQSAELSRAWSGAKISRPEIPLVAAPAASSRPSFLARPRRWAAAAAALTVPSLAFAKTASAATGASAAPALPALPAGLAAFLHAHGSYVAFGTSAVGLWVADKAVVYGVTRLAKLFKTKESTRVAMTFAARAILWVGGGIAAANAVGIPTTALVTAFGLGSVGVTMAVKEFIGNTIEGAKVFLNQPFIIGDKVQIGANVYEVSGMDLHYLYIKKDGRSSPEFKPWNEVSGATIKVFRPYTTHHKTRLWPALAKGGILGAAIKAPALMWQATKEMPRPNLRRASIWLAAGVGLLIGLPMLEKLALGALPAHLHSLAVPAGYTACGLAAAGVAYLGYRAAKFVNRIVDSIAAARHWNPKLVGAIKLVVAAFAAAGVGAGLFYGLPVLHSLVAISFAGHPGLVAGGLTTVFSWLQAGAIMTATRSVQKWLGAFIDHLAAKFKMNQQLVTVLKLGMEILTYLVGSSLALHRIGMTLGSLFTTLGASSAAIGWAAADVLGNATHGAWLLWRKPFEIGDWIEVEGGHIGEVKDMTVQYVVLSSEDGTHVLVPQAVMKKGFTPLRTPEDVAKAKASAADAAAQAAFLDELYRKSKAK